MEIDGKIATDDQRMQVLTRIESGEDDPRPTTQDTTPTLVRMAVLSKGQLRDILTGDYPPDVRRRAVFEFEQRVHHDAIQLCIEEVRTAAGDL